MNHSTANLVARYAGDRVMVYKEPTDPGLLETVITLEGGQVFVYAKDGASAGLAISGGSSRLCRAVVLQYPPAEYKADWALCEPPASFQYAHFDLRYWGHSWTKAFQLIACGQGDLALALANIWFIDQVPREILGRSVVSQSAADWIGKRLGVRVAA